MSRLRFTSATPHSSDESTSPSSLTTSSSLSGETNSPLNHRKFPYTSSSESLVQSLIRRQCTPGKHEATPSLAYPEIVVPHLLDENLNDLPLRQDPEGHELEDDLEDHVVEEDQEDGANQ